MIDVPFGLTKKKLQNVNSPIDPFNTLTSSLFSENLKSNYSIEEFGKILGIQNVYTKINKSS